MTSANPRTTTRNTTSRRGFSNNVPPGLHYLPPLDPKSVEFVELFRSFLSSKDERTSLLALSEEDGRIFIEIIDRAFRRARLEPELRQLAFYVLRELCGRIGSVPESYLLSDKFDLSGPPHASGGFADIRMGVFKGKNVAIKTLRVSAADDKAKIRKRFCKEVALWKNLSHPNVLGLIGIPDTVELSAVSEWMANGNITEYVRNNAGNHTKLLADAVEGLNYLHDTNIIHGDLKGADILITNANPVTACLADFEFTTIVDDLNLGIESSESEVSGGATPFMAPELLVPSRFGLDRAAPSKEADVYATAMVIYQVLTGELPFGKLSGSEVVFKVLGGARPSKPVNAPELGLSNKVWRLLEECWQTERALRPSVKDVLGHVKAAASVCGILPPVGSIPRKTEDPESDFTEFDRLFLEASPLDTVAGRSWDDAGQRTEGFRGFMASGPENAPPANNQPRIIPDTPSTESRVHSHIPSEGSLLETPSYSQTGHGFFAGDDQRIPDPYVEAQSNPPVFTAGPPRATFRISETRPPVPPSLLRQCWNACQAAFAVKSTTPPSHERDRRAAEQQVGDSSEAEVKRRDPTLRALRSCCCCQCLCC